ncbi:ATP-binding protein [Streptomyces pakalii]|uniref:ATP-binding protein n=1 Tax=Streptomyces pakalii TaxID=3036494 RepID=A0ABT7DH68_9ACTN|nr:ATP-binding protein [Streptomyces pakalii]MDJ1645175.1 ATP-binding protein [Streptomyces pakalii]
MTTFRPENALPLDTTIPDPSVVCLIGASGSGKSTWASTWPATQILELDAFRAMVSDDAGCQEATADAVFALQAVLEARLARRRMTIVDGTNSEKSVRAGLVATARRYGMPTVALVVPTPLPVCVERQSSRPRSRRVPEHVVRAQHAATAGAVSGLPAEGFDHVVVADNLGRLLPFLQRLSGARQADLGLDGSTGLGDLNLPARTFGKEILPLWRWKPGSNLAGGDRVAQIRLGQQYLTLALRTNIDGEGDLGFDVAVPCPHDDACAGRAWAPAYSITCLFRALNGDLDDEDIVCTVHGPNHDDGQDTAETSYEVLDRGLAGADR